MRPEDLRLELLVLHQGRIILYIGIFLKVGAITKPFLHRIQSFQRKSDAVSVCLVFEAAGVEDYQGAGYHHPQESLPAPKGLDSYPAIFSYPNVSSLSLLPNAVVVYMFTQVFMHSARTLRSQKVSFIMVV